MRGFWRFITGLDRSDWIAVVAMLVSLSGFGWAAYARLVSSQVRLYDFTEIVAFRDTRIHGDRFALSIETSQANIAEGDYGDVLEKAELTLTSGGQRIGCFAPDSLIELTWLPQDPPRAIRDIPIPQCEEQSCIDHPRTDGLFHIAVRRDALVQSLPQGQVLSVRWMFEPAPACLSGAPSFPADVNFAQVLDRIRGKDITVTYSVHTARDGVHEKSCRATIDEARAALAAENGVMNWACQPLPG